jgi:glutamyl-tRNA synthetase
LGNARTALLAWLSVRSQKGTLVWRLEDLDPPRVVPGLAREAERDLVWLGIDWDEGGGTDGPHAPYEQSARSDLYADAVKRLKAAGRVFPCSATRKDLRDVASAPHTPASGPAYPVELRPRDVAPDWLERILGGTDRDHAIRFRTADAANRFVDRVCGPQSANVAREVGDFVLRRRDGLWAYQLAVVVDDIDMKIDEVVRGKDLLDSTARQIQLIEALGGAVPHYAHVPVMRNTSGEKLSKRDESLTIESVRTAGVTADRLTGYLAWSAGLLDRPRRTTAKDLIEHFEWPRVAKDDFTVPEDATDRILAIA